MTKRKTLGERRAVREFRNHKRQMWKHLIARHEYDSMPEQSFISPDEEHARAHGVKHFVPIEEGHDAISRGTRDWWRVGYGRSDSSGRAEETYDFCSLKCLAVWADRHRKNLHAEGIPDASLGNPFREEKE